MPIQCQMQSLFPDEENEMNRYMETAQKLKERLRKLKEDLDSYKMVIDEVITPMYETKILQNQTSELTQKVNAQMTTFSDLKEKLAIHETFINASLYRQEDQLSKLEPQLVHLENQWRNQSSELEQVKQLWNDLGNKSVARAADVTSLDHSIKGLEERLTQQEEKVKAQELETTTLDNTLREAEEALVSLQDDLQESLNLQGRLDGVLLTLQKEIAEVRASVGSRGGGGGGGAPAIAASEADALCKKLPV
ncbi:Protein of unknown function [Gryllus bimaculatus]|nr:Protein of unknown function [Gryllus bimaculatus]